MHVWVWGSGSCYFQLDVFLASSLSALDLLITQHHQQGPPRLTGERRTVAP